jgi:hypothetical protein
MPGRSFKQHALRSLKPAFGSMLARYSSAA